jgi:hypothetical protein
MIEQLKGEIVGPRQIPCPKCGGTYKILCSWCHGQGGWNETYAGETKWVTCTYCTNGVKRCDNGCDGGYVMVWD